MMQQHEDYHVAFKFDIIIWSDDNFDKKAQSKDKEPFNPIIAEWGLKSASATWGA